MTAEEALEQLFVDYLAEYMSTENARPIYKDVVLSDMNQKVLHSIMDKDSIDDADAAIMIHIMGKQGNVSPAEEKEWSDDMVQEYADNLVNYLYTYKPEARQVDASIDPNEEHRGPMAQDIEKVAPDCIKETPEGIKTVDGNRLALVNAGVIGDLARRLIALEDKVNA